MNHTDRAPARHFRPQSERQRRAVLASIDAAERETLASEPAPLTADPYLLDTERTATSQANNLRAASPRPSPPLRLIKPAPEPAACGFGTCALTPECTRKCRYREADQALHGHYSERHGQQADQRTAMPEPKADHQLRRLVVIGLMVYAVVFVGYGVWLFSR